MSLIQNKTFEFVIYKENFLSDKECDDLIKTLDTDELHDATMVGGYEGSIVNKNVRNTLSTNFIDENLNKRLEGAIRVANTQYFNYDIESLSVLRFLKYDIGGNYNWHTDVGRNETSLRKLTAIIQLSEEKDYEGGDFEFGITDKEGTGLITGNRTKGCLLVFPSFLSHRVTPITKGKRYSIISWMEGDTYK